MKTKIFLFLITILLTSCSALKGPKVDQTYLSLKIFQTLGPNEALASRANVVSLDVFKIVKPIGSSTVYYDGLIIKGMFVLIDTYTYETVEGRTKTVPVYMMTSDYKAIMSQKEF